MAQQDGADPGTAVEKVATEVPSSGIAVVDESDSIENPGFPPFRPRVADVDPAKDRENSRRVSWLFLLSMAGSVFAIVAYIIFPIVPGDLGSVRLNTFFLGLGITLALLGVGFGVVHWSKTLMDGHDLVELRHPTRGSEATRARAAEIFTLGNQESGFTRRKMIRNTLIGALVLSPLPAVVLFRDLAPAADPVPLLKHTFWEKGTRLTRDPSGTPILASEVSLGSVFHVIPEGLNESEDRLEEKAKAAVLLMRLDPADLNPSPGKEDWAFRGIVAYSKICTHVGCPVALYEQQTHHLLCPCHQSQFDITQEAKVIFGPAKRPLPQLPIEVDDEGYLVAQSDFLEPVGPSFWGAFAVTVEIHHPVKETTETAPPGPGMRLTNWAANYVEDRTSLSGFVKELGRKIFPDHWSFMLGEVALYSFIVILLSGTFLTFFFQASMAEVTYEGSFPTLRGLDMSAAMASTLDISFEVRGGLLMRQIHHWAALLFVASIGLHMLRIFFTGAFRKPREINWIVGFLMFVLAMLEGFTGYSLPDDLLSGNGLRIIDGLIKGIPIVGTWTSYLIFGGEFPGNDAVGRFYSVHILLGPAILLALIGVHLILLIVNKHTQFAGPGRTEGNVVGVPIMPVFAAKAGGFFFLVFGVITLVAATVTINPIWLYGPYDPSPVSAGTQPDWYIGFADGALRLIPSGWEFVIWGYTLSLNILVPVLVLGLFLVVVAIYPFVEAWITGDKREHHIADRPRNAPTRTAIGAAGVTFYAGMWAAASSDLIATHFRLSIEGVTLGIQIITVLGPFAAYFLTKRICIGLQKKDREIALHGYESGRIVRLPGGEYVEVHEQLSDYDRWKLLNYDDYKPLMIRPDKQGRIRVTQRVRAVLSRWFYEDRIAPVSKGEIEAAHSDHH